MEWTKKYKVNAVIGSMKKTKVTVNETILINSIRTTRGDDFDYEDFMATCTPYYTKEELLIKELLEEVAALKDELRQAQATKRVPNKPITNEMWEGIEQAIVDGGTNKDIASVFGVASSTVSGRRKKLDTDKTEVTEESTINDSMSDYAQGLGD